MRNYAEAGMDVQVILLNEQMGRKGKCEIGQGGKKTGWEMGFQVGSIVVFTEADAR